MVAIHACTDSKALIYPGGRDEELLTVIVGSLKAAGITVAGRKAGYQGLNPKNICNRGLTGKGAQLEISRGLRDDLTSVHTLCDAIQTALSDAIALNFNTMGMKNN